MISTATQRWGRMDFAVAQRRDISAIAKVVYAVLKCYENDETGRCDPSQNMVADDAGTSIGSVKRSIKQLVDAGIIEVNRTPGSSRNAYRFLDSWVQNDTTGVQNDTSMSPKCDLHESILIPPRVQNDTSLHNNVYKNKKRTEKTSTSAGAIIPDDPGFVQPSSEQQQIAREMIRRWDELYPHTSPVADRIGDELAMQALQTIHNLDRDQIEAIVTGIGESGKIQFWKRPKNLTRRKSGSDDEPYVWQEIQSEVAAIEADKTPDWLRELDRAEVAR